MTNLKKVLMERDGLTDAEATSQIAEAKENLMARLADGEIPLDIMEEEFGLEPDYLEELIF